jgi:hypothetical protein
MASVTGGLFHPATTQTHITAAARPDAGPLGLAAITDTHTTIAGGADSVSGSAPAGGGSDTVGSGFDTVSGPQSDVRFSGTTPAGTEQVVATQAQEAGNTILHLPDGSTITILGVTHIDASFIH